MTTTLIHRDNWQNVRKMSRYNPDITFISIVNIYQIKPNDIIQICNGYERIWVSVKIMMINSKKYHLDWDIIGTIIEEVVCYASYKKGDTVQFQVKNIHHIIPHDKISK